MEYNNCRNLLVVILSIVTIIARQISSAALERVRARIICRGTAGGGRATELLLMER